MSICWCPVRNGQCADLGCFDSGVCVMSEETPTRKETMLKEAAAKKLRAWLNAPFEEIQRDLDSLAAVVDLTTDELNQLIAIGTVMADQKRVETPSPKPGGVLLRAARTGRVVIVKKEGGNGE